MLVRTGINSRLSSNLDQIGIFSSFQLRPTEDKTNALRLLMWKMLSFFYRKLIKLAENQDGHRVSGSLKFSHIGQYTLELFDLAKKPIFDVRVIVQANSRPDRR